MHSFNCRKCGSANTVVRENPEARTSAGRFSLLCVHCGEVDRRRSDGVQNSFKLIYSEQLIEQKEIDLKERAEAEECQRLEKKKAINNIGYCKPFEVRGGSERVAPDVPVKPVEHVAPVVKVSLISCVYDFFFKAN